MDIPAARRARICEIVYGRQKATVAELAQLLDVSEETIRRDISALHGEGAIQKVHGGAVAPSSPSFGAFERRQISKFAEKQGIAHAALACLPEGESVMINGGSTSEIFATIAAPQKAFSVITNSPPVARAFWRADRGADVFAIGGQLRNDTEETLGDIALQQLAQFNVRHAVLTADGVDAGQVDYFRADAAAIARMMISRARHVTLLADHTKLERHALFGAGELSEIHRLVTDRPPPDVVLAKLERAGVELVVANGIPADVESM